MVDAVDVAAYTVPTDAPEGDGTLSWTSTTLVLVRVRSGVTTGLGYTYGAAATTQVVGQLLADVVAGRSVWDVPAANEAMSRAVRNVGRPGLVAGAISAVDIALWDLKARLLGLPLVRLLGASRNEVPVYGSGGFTPYDEAQQDRQLRGWWKGKASPGSRSRSVSPGGRPNTATGNGLNGRAAASDHGRSCTSTPMVATPGSRPSGSPGSSPIRTSPGSRSPSPPTI